METILIVDDILINRVLLGEIVQQIGFDVEYAENGKAAIDFLYNHKIKVVLMDVEMPVMNGIEATKFIKSDPKLYKTKIVGVTAHDPRTFFKDYKDVSFDEFITKPFTVDRVSHALSLFLERTDLDS